MASGSKCTAVVGGQAAAIGSPEPDPNLHFRARAARNTTAAGIGQPKLEAHHLHAGVDEQNVAGHAARQIARQKNGGVRDFRGVRVPP